MRRLPRPANRLSAWFDAKSVHVAFEIGLLFKGLFALGEIAAGICAYVATRRILLEFARAVTKAELTEDPRDFVANHLLNAARHLSVSNRHFAAFYLSGHGALKLVLVIGILRRLRGAYPAAIAVFGAFIVYQLYRYGITHSIWLLLITAFDVVVLALICIEYRRYRSDRNFTD